MKKVLIILSSALLIKPIYNYSLKGLKSSIISVYGDALDKIGFSITEKANRSAQTRLGKTLKSLEKMETKEEVMYRKRKYEMQVQLDKLQQQKVNMRREHLKKASSLEQLYFIDGQPTPRSLKSTTNSNIQKPMPKSFRLLGTYPESGSCGQLDCSTLQTNKAGQPGLLINRNSSPITESNRLRTGSFNNNTSSAQYPEFTSGSFNNNTVDSSEDSNRHNVKPDALWMNEASNVMRPMSSTGVHKSAHHVEISRPASCNIKHKHKATETQHDNSKKHVSATEKTSKPSSVFPKLESKPHFLVQTTNGNLKTKEKHCSSRNLGSRRERTLMDLSMTPEPPRKRNMKKLRVYGSEAGSESSDNDSYSGKKTGGHLIVSSRHSSGEDWLPPTKEEMLQELAQQKLVLQYKVNAFLAKQNPQ